MLIGFRVKALSSAEDTREARRSEESDCLFSRMRSAVSNTCKKPTKVQGLGPGFTCFSRVQDIVLAFWVGFR